MNAFEDLVLGLNQAIEYEKGDSTKANKVVISTQPNACGIDNLKAKLSEIKSPNAKLTKEDIE